MKAIFTSAYLKFISAFRILLFASAAISVMPSFLTHNRRLVKHEGLEGHRTQFVDLCLR